MHGQDGRGTVTIKREMATCTIKTDEVRVRIPDPLPPTKQLKSTLQNMFEELKAEAAPPRALHIAVDPVPSFSMSHIQAAIQLWSAFNSNKETLRTRVSALCLYNSSESLQQLVQWVLKMRQNGRTTRPLRVWPMEAWDGEEVREWVAAVGSKPRSPGDTSEGDSDCESETLDRGEGGGAEGDQTADANSPSTNHMSSSETKPPVMEVDETTVKATANMLGIDVEKEGVKEGMETVRRNVARLQSEQIRIRRLFDVEKEVTEKHPTEFSQLMQFRRITTEMTEKFVACAKYLAKHKDPSINAKELEETQQAIAQELGAAEDPQEIYHKVKEGIRDASDMPPRLLEAWEEMKSDLISREKFLEALAAVHEAWKTGEERKNAIVRGYIDEWFVIMGGTDKEKFTTMYKAVFMHQADKMEALWDSDFLRTMELYRLYEFVKPNKHGEDKFKGATSMREFVLDKLHELAILTRLYKGLDCPVRDVLSRISDTADISEMTPEQIDELAHDYMSAMGVNSDELDAQKDAIPEEERQKLYRKGVHAIEGVLYSVLCKKGEARVAIVE